MNSLKIPPQISGFAMTMLGEILLIVGAIFFLLGASKFVSKIIGIEGGGEMITGGLLFLVSLFILSRVKLSIVERRAAPLPQQPMAGGMGKKEEDIDRSSAYR